MKVIVIGSGIVGASAAYHLAKNNTEVILIDKGHEGTVTTAGAGIVCQWISNVENDEWYKITKAGAHYYPELISQLKEDKEEDTGYKKVGALCVRSKSKELDAIEKEVKAKREGAPEIGDIERLDAKEAYEKFPPLNDELGAVFISGAARVDGGLLRDAMKRAAQRQGAKIIDGEAALIQEGGEVTGVKINNEIINADEVLITAGAWAPHLLAPLGIDLAVEPQRGQIAHIRSEERRVG